MNRLALFNNTSTVDAGDATVQDPTEVVDQQIAIFDADNIEGGTLNLTGANATDEMIIVQGDDKKPFVTQVIEKDAIKKVITKDHQAYINQVTNVGFTGSGSNSLNASAGDGFIKLTRLEKGFEQFPRTVADVTILSSDDEYDVAKKLAEEFNSKDGAKSFVRAEVLANQSSTQLQDTATTPANVTLDVTEGSKIAIVNIASGEDVDLAAGDYIRIGHATDLNYPVYKVEEVESNDGAETELEITLGRPYGSKDADATAVGKLDSNDLSAVEAGLELTAKDIDETDDFVESESAISFSTAASDEFDGTIIAIGTTPKTGSGNFNQMRAVEEQAAGMQKSFYHRNYFPQTPEYYADENTDYDVVVIVVELDNDNAVVNQNRYLEIVIGWDTGANIGTQLETFFGV